MSLSKVLLIRDIARAEREGRATADYLYSATELWDAFDNKEEAEKEADLKRGAQGRLPWEEPGGAV
jgi:hypothetical protein